MPTIAARIVSTVRAALSLDFVALDVSPGIKETCVTNVRGLNMALV